MKNLGFPERHTKDLGAVFVENRIETPTDSAPVGFVDALKTFLYQHDIRKHENDMRDELCVSIFLLLNSPLTKWQ